LPGQSHAETELLKSLRHDSEKDPERKTETNVEGRNMIIQDFLRRSSVTDILLLPGA
jgi:hypothetical protein